MNSFFEGMGLGWLYNINKSLSKHNLDAVNENGYTVLHSALLTNNFSEAKRLILNGANPLLQNINGETPLNLFANNLSVDETYSTFDSQIKLASEADKLSMFAFLIQNGYRDYIFRHENEYEDSVENGLLFDYVLLQGSVKKKFYDTIVFLTTHGYHKSNSTNSVIDEYQFFDLVRATINEENEGKDTSFNLNLIKLFLEAGFNPFWTHNGESAYSVASENSSVDILNIMPEQTQSYNKVKEYEDSSDKGDAEEYYALGLMYLNGDGVSEDIIKGMQFLREACDRGSAKGCNYLGFLYSHMKDADYFQVRELYTKACDGGNIEGCSNLGGMYLNGEGGSKDIGKAIELFSKACDGGDTGVCLQLGAIYLSGEVVEQDYSKAVEFFTKACDGGNAQACFYLAKLYGSGLGVRKDIEQAKKLLEKACDGGYDEGCETLATINDIYKSLE